MSNIFIIRPVISELDLVSLKDTRSVAHYMGNWISISRALKTARPEEVLFMLAHEVQNRKRPDIIKRIYGKYYSFIKEEELNILCPNLNPKK